MRTKNFSEHRVNKYIRLDEASFRYGASVAAWRRWVRQDLLGTAVVRFGRLVLLDTAQLDDRLRRTGQLLCDPVGTWKARQ